MQETKNTANENFYQEDDDLSNDEKPASVQWDDISIKNEVQELINEEMTEPELMFLCKDDEEATFLLKKCNKWTNQRNWTTMKNYLLDIIDSDALSDGILNAKLFVKYFYLGVSNFRLGDYTSALSSFIEGHKMHQQYQLIYNIALCYMKLNNLENAVFYLESVTKKNKNFFFAYYNLIKIYLKKNNINDAFLIYRDFSDIIKKERDKERLSEQTGIHNNRLSITSFNTLKLFFKIGAECLFAKQLYQECVYTVLEALKFNPEDPELWFLYAKVFIMKKSFEYAIPLLEKAIEIDPGYFEAKKVLAFLKENMD